MSEFKVGDRVQVHSFSGYIWTGVIAAFNPGYLYEYEIDVDGDEVLRLPADLNELVKVS